MSTLQLKEKLHNYIDMGEPRLLKMMYALSVQYHSDEIVGYKPNGEAITKKDFLSEIKQIEKEIDKGGFITVEQLEKHSENW